MLGYPNKLIDDLKNCHKITLLSVQLNHGIHGPKFLTGISRN